MRNNCISIGINAHPDILKGNLENLNKYLSYCEKIGFRHVEISPQGLDIIVGGRLLLERVKKVKEILSKYKLLYNIHVPNSVNLMDEKHEEIQLKIFYSVLEFAKIISAKLLVYHTGKIPYNYSSDKNKVRNYMKKEREILKELCSIASEWGILITIENANIDMDILKKKFFTYGVYIENLLEQILGVDRENIGITLDIGHGYIASKYLGYELIPSIKKVSKYVKNVHLHDNFGKINSSGREIEYKWKIIYGLDDLHLPPGWGEIPFEEIFKELELLPYYLTLELKPRHIEEFPIALEKAIKLSQLVSYSSCSTPKSRNSNF